MNRVFITLKLRISAQDFDDKVEHEYTTTICYLWNATAFYIALATLICCSYIIVIIEVY